MDAQIVSFGHQYLWETPGTFEGFTVVDARGLRDPYCIKRLRKLTGHHKAVKRNVMQADCAKTLVDALAKHVVDGDVNKVAFGCMGGRHRSVALAEVLAASLRAQGVNVTVEHREQHRWQA